MIIDLLLFFCLITVHKGKIVVLFRVLMTDLHTFKLSLQKNLTVGKF